MSEKWDSKHNWYFSCSKGLSLFLSSSMSSKRKLLLLYVVYQVIIIDQYCLHVLAPLSLGYGIVVVFDVNMWLQLNSLESIFKVSATEVEGRKPFLFGGKLWTCEFRDCTPLYMQKVAGKWRKWSWLILFSKVHRVTSVF
jgi:hypothetical protein